MSKDVETLLDDLGQLSLEEIDAKIDELQRQVRSLQLVRKLAATRQGSDEPTKNGRPHLMSVRKKIRQFLSHAGPTPLEMVALETGYDRDTVKRALNSRQFTKQPDGKYKVIRDTPS